MGWLFKFVTSSIGAKAIMGVTGILMVLWLVAHLAGNLLIFAGQDAINSYAAGLKGNAGLLWSVRAGMLALIVIHILAGLRLAALNRGARPQRYHGRTYQEARPWARAMAFSGVLLAFFVVFHLLHFTVGNVHPDYFILEDSKERHDVYNMFVLSFRDPATAGVYVLAMLLLAAHLVHGTPSFFQSLGINTPRWAPITRRLGMGLALAIVLGNITMPTAVLGGLIQPTSDLRRRGDPMPSARAEEPAAQGAMAEGMPMAPNADRMPMPPGARPAPLPGQVPLPRVLQEGGMQQPGRPLDPRMFPRPMPARPPAQPTPAPQPGEAP